MDDLDILKRNVLELNTQLFNANIRIKELVEENNYCRLKLEVTEDSLEKLSQQALGYRQKFK
tara:strand:- start:860 stop:1045 length:186 start_codon:yes stop_codon:yes gene_type:complete